MRKLIILSLIGIGAYLILSKRKVYAEEISLPEVPEAKTLWPTDFSIPPLALLPEPAPTLPQTRDEYCATKYGHLWMGGILYALCMEHPEI